MRESVIISHSRFANAGDIAGFVDVLSATLAEQGSSADIQTQQVSVFALDGNQFRVLWTADYEFASPDNHFSFKHQLGAVEVESRCLNYDTLMLLMGGRDRKLSAAYRTTLRNICNVALSLREGVCSPSLPPMEYLEETLRAALQAFPNRD